MNLDILGNIGEFVGAVGVIISLVYLSVQLRQNTKALRASSYQEISHNSRELLELLILDGEMAEIFTRGREGGVEVLTPVERVRWHAMLLAIFRHWDNLFYQYRNQMLERELWKSYQHVIRGYMAEVGFQEWWSEQRDGFSMSLQELINGIIARQELRPESFAPARPPRPVPDIEESHPVA